MLIRLTYYPTEAPISECVCNLHTSKMTRDESICAFNWLKALWDEHADYFEIERLRTRYGQPFCTEVLNSNAWCQIFRLDCTFWSSIISHTIFPSNNHAICLASDTVQKRNRKNTVWHKNIRFNFHASIVGQRLMNSSTSIEMWSNLNKNTSAWNVIEWFCSTFLWSVKFFSSQQLKNRTDIRAEHWIQEQMRKKVEEQKK